VVNKVLFSIYAHTGLRTVNPTAHAGSVYIPLPLPFPLIFTPLFPLSALEVFLKNDMCYINSRFTYIHTYLLTYLLTLPPNLYGTIYGSTLIIKMCPVCVLPHSKLCPTPSGSPF